MRLIDADALKEYILNKGFYCDTESDKQYSAELVDKNFPTIQAVPLEDYRSMEQTVHKLTQALAEAEPIKHGKWEFNGYYISTASGIIQVKCSKCGFKTLAHGVNDYNYCPNCGADMREVEE